jgi:cytochrome c-type biogenesis protein CcmH/NrfG/rRNA-processing protein FCF1
MRTVVLDTNVLLSEPDIMNAFADAEVVVPETVLGELDRLKTARVDPDLRFKGREISRMLFELSETGVLTEGVELGNGGVLRVVPLRNENDLPEGLSSRNADDRILAVAIQIMKDGAEDLQLVTNDLNMLLKAQTLGVPVDRTRTRSVDSFGRRFIIRPFQRYRVPLTILAIALAVFAAVIYLTVFSPFAPSRQVSGLAAIPQEFIDQLSLEQQQILTYLFRLQNNPKDFEAQKSIAILYDTLSDTNVAYVPYALKHYELAMQLNPSDNDVRTDLATTYYRSNKIAQAIQQVTIVLRDDPNHINANFNLGVFYWNSNPKEYQKAADQFTKVIRLTANDTALKDTNTKATQALAAVQKEAATAGVTIKTGGTL